MVDITDISDEQLREIEYKGYEIDPIDKANVAEIKRMLATNSFKSEQMIQENLDYLEKLADKLEDAYKAELSVRNNVTLLMELKNVQKLMQQMMSLLERF